MKTTRESRLDVRLPKELKASFLYAANIGGFRTFSEFVLSSIQRHANDIIEKHNTILASAKDQQIFFDALMKADKPNSALKKAASRYKKSLARQ